ncbi:MAG: YwaF family protein [Clostridia bacterium]
MTFIDWISGANNPSLPKSQYLYGTRHIILLCLVVFLAIIMSFVLRNKSERTKRIFFKTCACVFLAMEVLSRIFNLIFTDNYSFENIVKIVLPLHFCSVVVWLIIIALLVDNKPLINAAAIFGLLATTAFLLYPAVGLNKVYMSFDALYSISSHSLGWVVSILLMTSGYAKFEMKKIWQTFVVFFSIIAYGALFDFVIFPGADYMYLRNNPLPFTSPIPYQIIFLVVLLIYISIFYIVPLITNKIKKKRIKPVV